MARRRIADESDPVSWVVGVIGMAVTGALALIIVLFVDYTPDDYETQSPWGTVLYLAVAAFAVFAIIVLYYGFVRLRDGHNRTRG